MPFFRLFAVVTKSASSMVVWSDQPAERKTDIRACDLMTQLHIWVNGLAGDLSGKFCRHMFYHLKDISYKSL